VTQPKKEIDENPESDWSSDEEDLPEVPVASKPKPSGKGKGQSFRNVWMFWLEAVMSVIYMCLSLGACRPNHICKCCHEAQELGTRLTAAEAIAVVCKQFLHVR